MIKKFICLVAGLIFLLVALAPPVFGLSANDQGFLNTPFYDPNSTENLCGAGGDFTGSNNVEIAFNYLVSQGLSAEQSAGIVGNLMVESGQSIDPLAANGDNYRGIAQWDTSVRWPRLVEWAEQNKKDPLDVKVQLEYLWEEATERGNIEGIKEQTAVDLAAWYWGRFFEVAIVGGSTDETPLTNVQGLEDRISNGQKVFDEYSANGTSGGTCSGTLGEVECPANMEAHPYQQGYFKMPEATNEEYTIYSSQERRYGSRELVCVLYSVALAYNEAMAGRSRMQIGDLNASGHKTHNEGTAVDLSGFGEIQAASHIRPWKGTYSKEATVLLGKLFIDTGQIRNIWWCPPPGDTSIEEILDYADQIGKPIEGEMKCISGHSDHFHLDIKAQYRLGFWEP